MGRRESKPCILSIFGCTELEIVVVLVGGIIFEIDINKMCYVKKTMKMVRK